MASYVSVIATGDGRQIIHKVLQVKIHLESYLSRMNQ